MADQLSIDVGVTASPEARVRWSGLPYRDTRRCATCGQVTMTAGRRRSSQRCLPCFAQSRRSRSRGSS